MNKLGSRMDQDVCGRFMNKLGSRSINEGV